MIVKRFADALRRQDWAMVAIEFALVVVGVLLAFQINEWANERASDGERQLSAERLLEEAELDVAYIRQAVDYERKVVQGLGFATGRIVGKKLQETDEKRITASFG